MITPTFKSLFKAFEADLPVQMGQTIELRDYQQEATENLQKMREDGKTIALLYSFQGLGIKQKPETVTWQSGGFCVESEFMARPWIPIGCISWWKNPAA